MNLKHFTAAHAEEFGKFERIKNPPSTHRDLCAMLILSKFMTNPRTSVINCAESAKEDEHGCGIIVFEPSRHDIETMATEAQVIDLIRCGCCYNSEYDALVMDI